MSDKHRQAILKEVWQRDYELVAQHHPLLLDKIEQAVSDKVTPEMIKRWVAPEVEEPLILQRVCNAARYCEANK